MLLVFLGGLILTLFRERLSKAIEATLFWAVIGLLLVVGYSYRFELREVTDRVVAELVPGHVPGHGRNVEVVRGHGGGQRPLKQSLTRLLGYPLSLVLRFLRNAGVDPCKCSALN